MRVLSTFVIYHVFFSLPSVLIDLEASFFRLTIMSIIAEASEIKKHIVELEKFSAELRGYL